MKLTMLIPMLVAVVAATAPIEVGAQPPPPPGKVLRPGMMWCDVCGGDGTHGRTWYGWHKTCRKCGGTGMLVRPVPPPPPAPPPKVHHNHHPKPGPAQHHHVSKPGPVQHQAPNHMRQQAPGHTYQHNAPKPGRP